MTMMMMMRMIIEDEDCRLLMVMIMLLSPCLQTRLSPDIPNEVYKVTTTSRMINRYLTIPSKSLVDDAQIISD